MKTKLKINTIVIITLYMFILLACDDDHGSNYTPVFIEEAQVIPGEEEDIGFKEDLPPYLTPINYTPSQKPHLYRPILVEYANSPTSAWKTEKTRILRHLSDFVPDYRSAVYKQKTNKYGSATHLPRQEVTGRYYVKKIDGRWWIIDPEGYIRYERSVTSVRKGGSARNIAAWNEKYGSDAVWIEELQKELAFFGIHGTGAFSTTSLGSGSGGYEAIQSHNAAHPEAPLSLAPSFGTLSNFSAQRGHPYPGGTNTNAAGLVFYEGWEEFAREFLSQQLIPYKDDPNTLGFFSDNEIDFSSMNSHMLDRFLKLEDKTNPAYIAARNFMDSKNEQVVTDQLNDEFSGIVSEKYYKAIKEARDVVAPNLMYLGSRLHGTPKYLEGVIRAAGKYCDIISINYYSRWSPELSDWILKWEEWSPNAPFFVTEFYTKALDNDLSNDSGVGFAVKTEKDKAFAFQHFALGLIEAKNCVGWQWFRYQDEDYPDASNKPSNKGLYDNYYNYYPYLAAYMRRFNYNVYELAVHFDKQ